MNKLDQNIAIALTQGFQWCSNGWGHRFLGLPGTPNNYGPDDSSPLCKDAYDGVPSYTESETEMRKVLLTLPGGYRRSYCKELYLVVCGDAAPDGEDEFYALTAPAFMQAEAYLRALGKWSLGGPATPLTAAELDSLHK